MSATKQDQIRQSVRKTYADVATKAASGCCEPLPNVSCCAPNTDPQSVSQAMGYSADDVDGVPQGANMGLGCGNPQAIAAIKEGEVVMDLGSGGGFDSFLAAKQVGASGHVIGIDMTPDMISLARSNVEKTDFKNVEFRLGEIENIPAADNSVNVIMSNCVINLSPNKSKVYKEAFRVLKPGGRLAISDVILTATLPDDVKNDLSLYSGCISGAIDTIETEELLKQAGFSKIKIEPKDESREFIREWAPGKNIDDYVVSATIEAIK